MSVQTELGSTRRLGEQLEELVVRRGQCPDEDFNILLIGYWALIFDYHKGILAPVALCGRFLRIQNPSMRRR